MFFVLFFSTTKILKSQHVVIHNLFFNTIVTHITELKEIEHNAETLKHNSI
jgi:hypothetical protein